jgi:hypothetical protein
LFLCELQVSLRLIFWFETQESGRFLGLFPSYVARLHTNTARGKALGQYPHRIATNDQADADRAGSLGFGQWLKSARRRTGWIEDGIGPGSRDLNLCPLQVHALHQSDKTLISTQRFE